MRGRIALTSVLALAAGVAACGGDDGKDEERKPQAACSSVKRVEVPKAANYHTNKNYTARDYNSRPPAGGPHSNGFLSAGKGYSKAPMGDAVHSLDHGAVILWTNKLPAAEQRTVERVFNSLRAKDTFNPGNKYVQINGVENPDMPTKFAMSAWGVVQTCDRVDERAIRSFVEKYYASGPEGKTVACSGLLGKPPRVPACRK